MIRVIATIELAEGRRDDFLAIFRELGPKVRAEAGCREYAAWIDMPTILGSQPPARESVVTILEKWESVEALETHLMAPHMQEFRKATETMRRGIQLRLLEPA